MKRILKHYWPEIKKYWVLILILMMGMLLSVAIDLAIPFFLREFADLLAYTEIDHPEYFETLLSIFWSLVLLYFGMWFVWRVKEFIIIHFEADAIRDMECRAFTCLQRQSLRFFKESFAGSLLKKLTRFTRSFEGLMDVFYFDFSHQIFKILAIFVIFIAEKPVLGLVFFVWATVFIVGSYLFALWKMKYDIISAAADSRISGVLADSLSNYSTVKTFSRESEEFDRFQNVSRDRCHKMKFTWLLSMYADSFQTFLMLSFELLLFYFVIQWWKDGIFTVGDFIFLQAYLLVLFHSLWDFGHHIRNTFQYVAEAKEMAEIFEQDPEVKDIPEAKDLQVRKGEIEFKSVEFAFEEDEKKLFGKLSLTIPAGQKVALVGPSGAGKTTIVKLLFRFYDINKGEILIDGQNIAQVTQKSLRRNISLVPQDPDLFHRTLSENIAFGNPSAKKAEIVEAAKLAHAHEYIENFPKQYNTLVGERGVKLSGGEKQRIAIARAFLENAPILILDEATSALDSLTEKIIQDAISKLMKNRTSIVIAHRLSTILNMDRIIVIQEGGIIEDGTHQELLSQKGLYYALWNHQAGGFIGEDMDK